MSPPEVKKRIASAALLPGLPSRIIRNSRPTLSAPSLRQVCQRLGGFYIAPSAKLDELSDINPAAPQFRSCHPPQALTDPIRQFPLRELRFLTQLPQEERHFPIDQSLVALGRHRAELSAPATLK